MYFLIGTTFLSLTSPATSIATGVASDVTLDALTGVLCAIGAVQAFVFWVQAGRLKDSVEETRTATATINENAETELRAYLSVTIDGADHPSMWTDHVARIRLVVINSGKTPAAELVTTFEVRLLPKDSDLSGELPMLGSVGARRGMLGIGGQIEVPLAGPHFADEEWPKLDVGSGLCLFVYGTVVYRDIFGKGRLTNFCRYVNWKNGVPESPATEYGNDFT